MKAANQQLFRELDRFCSLRDAPLMRAGKPRWIRTDDLDKAFLKNALVTARLSLAPFIKLVHYEFKCRSYIMASGLEVSDPPRGLSQEDLGGGALTLFLAEENPTPIASAAAIRDALDFDDFSANKNYEGLGIQQVASLFPQIQLFSAQSLASGDLYKTFFLLALCSKPAIQASDGRFIETIRGLAELSSQAIPYQTLCRSVLDADPSAMFLALYRCLEALYAFSHSQVLKQKLRLDVSWSDLASTLEEVLDWRPREEPSLAALLSHSDPEKLEELARCFGEMVPDGSTFSTFIAKRIYRLRNQTVHYRPFQQETSLIPQDWPRITEALAVLIFHLYERMPLGSSPRPPEAPDRSTVLIGDAFSQRSTPAKSAESASKAARPPVTLNSSKVVIASICVSGILGVFAFRKTLFRALKRPISTDEFAS